MNVVLENTHDTSSEASVELRPLDLDNIYQHFRWNNDPELNRLDSSQPFEEESFNVFKRRFEQMVYDPHPTRRDFELHAEDGTLIGVVHVVGISKPNAHCTITVTIGNRDYWGKGYGRATMKQLLDYCFNELEMHRVAAEVFEFNDAWKGLVESAGFQRDGVHRDFLCRDGEYWDLAVYSLLEGEYRS